MSKNEEIAVDPWNQMCTYMFMQSSDFSAQITWKKFTFINNMFHIGGKLKSSHKSLFVCVLVFSLLFLIFIIRCKDFTLVDKYWRNMWHLHQYSQWKSLW